MDTYDERSDAPRESEASRGPDAPHGPWTPHGPGASRGPDAPTDGGSQVSDPSAGESPAGDAVAVASASSDPEAAEPVGEVPAVDGPELADPVVGASGAGDPVGDGPGAADPAGDDRAADDPLTRGRAGLAALSLPAQILVALALAVVAVVACVHLGMVFLHVAPSNTVTKQHGEAIDDWIYPEFEQNWKLFAPNPLQQNIAVQVRAEVGTAEGGVRTTGWYDLSALDGEAIDGNLLPSHTQQNALRRAWDFYVSSHDGEDRATGRRGDLSERYLRRLVVMRLEREGAAGAGEVVERVQVRSRTTDVPPPEWSEEKVSDKPVVRELPWWPVTEADRTGAGV